MSQEPKNNEEGFMYKLASFIVDKRNLIFLIVAIGLVFSAFSRNWVQVENQLSAYLKPQNWRKRSAEAFRRNYTVLP